MHVDTVGNGIRHANISVLAIAQIDRYRTKSLAMLLGS